MGITLKEYIEKEPEIIFEWNDLESEARGWLVINSLKNGAAGGGTRMRKGLTKDEVVSLAKVMEVKFTVSGPPIGGAKSGISFDPNDPRKNEVIQRWFKAVFPILKAYYGTGGDLNIDEIKDVIPMTENLGLWHPQEGVVNGHFSGHSGEKIHRIGQLRFGVAKILEDRNYAPVDHQRLSVADMITGWGVSEAVKHTYQLFVEEELRGQKAIIQGWGNVASAAAYYLARLGVKIVGIIDRNSGVIQPEGFSFDEVEALFLNKKGNKLVADRAISFEETNEKIWNLNADIFVPGAASKIVTREQMENLIEGGLKVMSCGANVPFVDDKIFFGDTAEWVDKNIHLIPDFIANCGMARTFAFLMQREVEITDQSIFEDVSDTISKALQEIKQNNPSGENMFMSAIRLALEK